MQEALKESVDFFSPKRKQERELWVGKSFIENLGVLFKDGELFTPPQDPPDVSFREARFEIKEILDAERKRHQEFKDKLKKAYEATEPADFLEEYRPIDITPEDIGTLIINSLGKFSEKYDPQTRSNLDLLIYINLSKSLLKSDSLPARSAFSEFGWRSISALKGWGSLVFYTNCSAPDFLQEKEGLLTIRQFPQ